MSKLKYGYQWQEGKITINPAQAEVIKQIFAGFLASQTRNQLARQFNLTHTTVSRILTSNKYTGAEGYPQIVNVTDKFYRGIIKKYSDDAFKQAEHIYQLIYSEVEVYGES